MAIFVTGDTHGCHDLYKVYRWDCEVGKDLGDGDYLIVAGDFGYPWSFLPDECEEIEWLESRPYTVLFVDGNHERYDHWNERPVEEWHGGRTQRLSDHSPIRRLCRGEVFDLDGEKIFTMGGATSPDMTWRAEGISWWPCELPSDAEYENARANLDCNNWQVDYVITHTCATSMLGRTLWPDYGWQTPTTDRLTNFFDELENNLGFKRWYYGHFHRDRDVDDRHAVLFDRVVPLGESADFRSEPLASE